MGPGSAKQRKERCIASGTRARLSGRLPLILDAERALVRLHRGAVFAVVVGIKTPLLGQAERSSRAKVDNDASFVVLLSLRLERPCVSWVARPI